MAIRVYTERGVPPVFPIVCVNNNKREPQKHYRTSKNIPVQDCDTAGIHGERVKIRYSPHVQSEGGLDILA